MENKETRLHELSVLFLLELVNLQILTVLTMGSKLEQVCFLWSVKMAVLTHQWRAMHFKFVLQQRDFLQGRLIILAGSQHLVRVGPR